MENKIIFSVFRDDLPALKKALDITFPFIRSSVIDEVSRQSGNIGVIVEIEFQDHVTIADIFFVGIKFGEQKIKFENNK